MRRYFLFVTLIKLFVFVFICCPPGSSIMVRIRLPTGLLQRLDVDEDSSLADITAKIIGHNWATTNSSCIIGDTTYGFNNSVHSISLKSIGIKNGDIISIKIPETTDSDVAVSTPSRDKSKVTSAKSKSQSLNDWQKKRQDMVKIAREKSSRDRIVRISSTTGRILKRSLDHGGLGLLLGRVVKNRKEINEKKNSKTAASRQFKSFKGSSDNGDVEEVNSIEVHGICEIFNCLDDGKPLLWNTLGNEVVTKRIEDIKLLACRLGLSIVGCSVALPLDSAKTAWTSYHVHATLQLRSICGGNANFTAISVNRQTIEDDKAKGATGKKQFKSHKFSLNHDSGISLEAFLLSNQTSSLFDQQYFDTLVPPVGYETSAKGLDLESVVLTKEVLLNAEDTKVVNALLLAVPLPIGAFPSSVDHDNSGVSSIPSMEHSFPSQSELSQAKTLKLAKRHLLKILGTINKGDTNERLRDPHLLLFISSVIDGSSMDLLCKAIMDSSSSNYRIPSSIVAVFEIVKSAIADE